MKLLRYGPVGQEKPGILDAEGRVRSLADVIPDLTPEHLSAASLAKLSAIDPETLPVVDGNPRLGVPFAGTRQFIGVGMSYAEHVAELGLPTPTEPLMFIKAIGCLSGPNDDVIIPRGATKTDWEVELGIVIGKTARCIEEADASDHIAGYCVVNDVSDRGFQMDRGGTWDKGKGCDTFGPVGPWLVTQDEVGNPAELDLWLDVNGKRMQTGNTRTMLFSVEMIVSYVSGFMTLEPGDIITTGTPPGVGMGMKPEPIYLVAGDTMTLGVEKLGEQHQSVVAWKRS